jgi:hypothetical protein
MTREYFSQAMAVSRMMGLVLLPFALLALYSFASDFLAH